MSDEVKEENIPGEDVEEIMPESAESKNTTRLPRDETETILASADPTATYIDECITKSLNLKAEGLTLFRAKDFDGARAKYIAALESLQYAGENLTQDQKAALFELTIPLSSNAALCFFKAKNYSDCLTFTKNALVFIKVLEENTKTSADIWQTLQARGMTMVKLNDLKKKSLTLAGKSNYYRCNYVESIQQLQEAIGLIPEGERIKSEKESGWVELNSWLEKATAKEASVLKKEKAMWGKAFKGDKEVDLTLSNNTSTVETNGKSNAEKKKKRVSFSTTNNGKSSAPTIVVKNYGWMIGAAGFMGLVGGALYYVFRNKKSSKW